MAGVARGLGSSHPAPLLANLNEVRCDLTQDGGREDRGSEERFGPAEAKHYIAVHIFDHQQVINPHVSQR
jgi:hypothetical protein